MSRPVDRLAIRFSDCKPLFMALGEIARQQILLLLIENEALNVSQLAERLPLSRPAISHHLKALRQAGLIEVQPFGTENRYSARLADAAALLQRFAAELRVCG